MPLPRRKMPVETILGLRPPATEFDYFAQNDVPEFAFQPRLGPGSSLLVNASWLADACFLVYGPARFIETHLNGIRFELGWIGERDNNQGMFLLNEQAMILVFRGTRLEVNSALDKLEFTTINADDLKIDATFLPRVCEAGGHVHRGFLDAFKSSCGAMDLILSRRTPGQALWITGHSLGGAIATLAAAHIGAENIEGLFTYGCPRVGDAAFTKALPTRNYARFVHRDDWVTTVPPEPILGYKHAGELVEISAGKRDFLAEITTGAQEFFEAIKAMRGEPLIQPDTLPFRLAGIADHAPIYYATLLWNALIERHGA